MNRRIRFLENLVYFQAVKKLIRFYGKRCPLEHVQVSATHPCPQANEVIPHPHIICI